MSRNDPHDWMPRRRIIAAATVLLVLILATGLVIVRESARPAGTAVNLASLYWIYYKEDLNRLHALDPALIAATLSGPGTYALEQSGAGSRLPAGAIPIQLFFGSAGFATALQQDAIISGVRNVAYDPEDWPATPVAEQQNPLAAMKGFAAAAHSRGLRPMLLPGRDLMQVPGGVCAKKQGDTLSQAYLSCQIPSAAAGAPIFVIQSAPVEADLTQLVNLVRRASVQARTVNPKVIIIATLNTAPGGTPVSSAEVTKAARKILPYVQGFLINSTPATDPGIISFLQALQKGS